MQRVSFLNAFLLFLVCSVLFGQNYQAPIDTVLWFHPGRGQALGQDSAYFPKNIFTLPDSNASDNIPSSSPKDICSLGLGGEIVVGFKNFLIYDGDGPDFTIFENAFINPVTKKVFAEPAIISVSQDGLNFYDFPWDYTTLEGCAGTKPTNGKANPFDPSVSGGNSFDLSALGLKTIRWIKIKDICDTILKNPSHPFYDALLSGFDLDCVVGLHLIPIQLSSASEIKDTLIYKIHNSSLEFSAKNFSISVYNLLGCEIFSANSVCDKTCINFSLFEENFFLVVIKNKNNFVVLKVIRVGSEILLD